MPGDSMKVMQPHVQNCPPMRPTSAPTFLPSLPPLPAVLYTQQVPASVTTPLPSAKPVEVVIPPVSKSHTQSQDPQPRPNGTPSPSAPINIPPPKPANVVPPNFKLLVQSLQTHRSNGNHRPLRSIVSLNICNNGLTYKNAGVSKFKEYAALAEKRGIVELGGREATAWISLKPEFHGATVT
ncbi:hypothetical protein BDZ97DRAFT_160345 [Flammula alnicola]|nr:hypothetical protein BDZ97DRAFT_160345 [Flammula alnicola]